MALGLLLATMAVMAQAQAQVARVLETRGTALVERSGQAARLLGAGERLDERDVIHVSRDSWAIIEFNDQTRVSLRPNTVFRLEAYKADAPETMLLGLTKGGLRVVTGLFGKRNPRGVSIQTATATIGIRGTEFDARLCDADCAAEERAKPAPRQVLLPVARVVEMNGVVAAARAGESGRVLVPGAMLYEGDGVATGPAAQALLVFRDGARVTLAQDSRFSINRFQFSESSPQNGSAFLTLLAGNAQVWTGQLAKISPDAFLVRSAIGIIRPHGTGISINSPPPPPPPPSASEVKDKAQNAGEDATKAAQDAAKAAQNAAQNAGNTAGSGAQNTVNAVIQGAQNAAQGQSMSGPDIAKVPTGGPVPFVPIPFPVVSQGTQDQARQVAASVQNSASEAGNKVATQVQNATQSAADAAVNQAVNALNTAIAPIVGEMTALMAQMRNNPPQTAAAAQQLSTRIDQLSQLLNTAITGARNAAGAVAQSDAFRAVAGMAMAEYLTFHSVMATGMQGAAGAGGTFVFNGAMYNNEIARILADPYSLGSVGLIGLSSADLVAARNAGVLAGGLGVIQPEIAGHLAAQGSAAAKAFFSEAQTTATVLQQRAAQEAARVAAEAKAAEAKRAATEKLAAEEKQRIAAEAEKAAAAAKVAAEAKAAADKQLAEAKARAAADEARRQAEAGLRNLADGQRSYDITGALIAVVGPPDRAIGSLITQPGPPVVTRVGDNVITTWVEPVVNPVMTAQGGYSLGGTVTRTEVAGPDGVTTTLVFNVMFVSPMVTGLVPHVGGPLISLGDDRPGTVQVTHRAPDGTTTVSYPGNQDDSKNPSSVVVLDGEVEIMGRGRVQKGEMLASTGGKLRMASLATVPDIKVAPGLFGDSGKPVEEGLYVWVRDGAVQLTQDNRSVDVAAGNAAVATKDTLRVLDTVPGFLRFDNTPRPFPALPGGIDIFRASDGAMLNMCSIR